MTVGEVLRSYLSGTSAASIALIQSVTGQGNSIVSVEPVSNSRVRVATSDGRLLLVEGHGAVAAIAHNGNWQRTIYPTFFPGMHPTRPDRLTMEAAFLQSLRRRLTQADSEYTLPLGRLGLAALGAVLPYTEQPRGCPNYNPTGMSAGRAGPWCWAKRIVAPGHIYFSALVSFPSRVEGYDAMARFLTNGHYRAVGGLNSLSELSDPEPYAIAINVWKGGRGSDNYRTLAARAVRYFQAALRGVE